MAENLRVNMRSQRIVREPVKPEYERLGGRGLTSAIVSDEVPPTSHPLSPKNKLILAPGLLAGTSAPCSGRLSARTGRCACGSASAVSSAHPPEGADTPGADGSGISAGGLRGVPLSRIFSGTERSFCVGEESVYSLVAP